MPRTNASVRAPNDRNAQFRDQLIGLCSIGNRPVDDGASGALDREGAQGRLHAVDGD
jgi:hypothetical protein